MKIKYPTNSVAPNNFKILSLNCRGLANKEKRRDLFAFFKEKNCDIIFLQDTHWDTEIGLLAKQEWDYKITFAPFNTRSRGTAILFNNTFKFSLGITKNDDSGNYTFIELVLPNTLCFILGSIYAPNQDCPNFISNLSNIITDYENPNIMLGGDWNSTRIYELDNLNYVKQNNPRMTVAINQLAETFSLVDAWRTSNPAKKQYTWLLAISNKQARVDYFLCSDALLSITNNYKIDPKYRSDHAPILVQSPPVPRTEVLGPGNSIMTYY